MAKLNYKVYGKGKPLIVMHGLYGSSDNWVSIARDLMDDYTVYLLDMRNHGLSPHTTELNYTLMTDDLLEFMNDRGLYSSIIMGHSMGGKVAMSFASLYPEKVQKLIVVDISPRGYSSLDGDKQFDEHTTILGALRDISLNTLASRKEADELIKDKITSEGVRMFLLKNLVRTKENTFYWRMNLPVLMESLPNIIVGLESEFDDLSLFENPVLFVKGGNSYYIQEKDILMINELFKQVRVEIIEGASHWVHAEKKEEFIRIVRQFLNN